MSHKFHVTKEQLDAHARMLRDQGKNPESDPFFRSMSQFHALNTEMVVKGSPEGISAPGLELNHLKARELYEMQSKSSKGPYWNTIIKEGGNDNYDLLIGAFEATTERLEQSRSRGYSWEAEVQIILSNQMRNRVVRVTLFSPHIKKPDLSVRSLKDHLEARKEERTVTSRAAGTWQYFLEEHDRVGQTNSHGQPYIAPMNEDRIITIDGLIRLLRETVAKSADERSGSVGGNLMIRLQLERAFGIIFRAHHMSQDPYSSYIRSWIQDIVEFTGSNRHRYWSQEENMFVTRSPDQIRPPATPMEVIWRQMAERT